MSQTLRDDMFPELVESLSGMVNIVKAFTYTTTLGRTQKERLEKAIALLEKAKSQ